MKRASDKAFTVLVVDDEPVALKTMTRILKKEGFETVAAASGEEAQRILARRSFDVVLTDLMLGAVDGLELLKEARRRNAATEVIIITGFASVDTAIEATRHGAFHYLQKPIRPEEVRLVVHRALEKVGLARRVNELEQRSGDWSSTIVGNSRSIQELKKLIGRLADSDSNVMITGESGTGKELVARAIHAASKRREKRFLAFNCASLTDELLANELFGHEKDAFTGASKTRPGLLEAADGGTVFMDEVGDMSPAMQAKLLRATQERELLRVGGTDPVPVDLRFIAATNKDLKKLCAAGLFRQDLFFRLNVIPLHLPSLSERQEDIPLLAACFLSRYAARTGKQLSGFTGEALKLLCDYTYPGNVRELENIVERAAALCREESITAADLPPDLKDFSSVTFRHDQSKMKTLEEVEHEYIAWVLERTGHNKSEASRLLGIDRASLHRKLKRKEIKE